ncbi:MarR family winged helix-turn-helix transcriptional regulator [Streptacidiphilus sp. EB129]|jgi:DNA-binding MarR family transcriptional regulator|uniref:MarR family winged helix-turn-helix transcriptional regulator n=1 Tax=Streptacidiphilus sp. EB129 TaxID=3156262 RepID=UPI0035152080
MSPDAADAAALPADRVDAIIEQWGRVRPDLDTEAMAVFGRINRIANAMGARMVEAYGRYGISRGEFDVLGTLRRAGEPYTLSPRELTATLMLTTGGMTGRLDKLEKAGLVRRSPDPNDRRGLRVTLTLTGLRLIDEAVGDGLAVQAEAVAALTGPDVTELERLLRLLLAACED